MSQSLLRQRLLPDIKCKVISFDNCSVSIASSSAITSGQEDADLADFYREVSIASSSAITSGHHAARFFALLINVSIASSSAITSGLLEVMWKAGWIEGLNRFFVSDYFRTQYEERD